MLENLKLMVSKKDGRIYKNVETLRPSFQSEKELVRHLTREHGEGLYIIQFTCKGRKGVSNALWRGYIRPETETEISYMNKIDDKLLEEVAGIKQERPTDRHVLELQ